MNKIATLLRESGLARFLIPTGLMLIIFGVIVFVININNQNYIKTDSYVTKTELQEAEHTDIDGNHVEATYIVYVKYTVDGKDYEATLEGLPKYKEGKRITIYYNPEDPNKITQTKSLILPIAIIAGGVAALIGGIVSGINAYKRYKKMKEQEKGWEKHE